MENPESISVQVDTIVGWLGTKRTTLWSTYAIDDDKGKQRAAEWFYKELESLVIYTANKVREESLVKVNAGAQV